MLHIYTQFYFFRFCFILLNFCQLLKWSHVTHPFKKVAYIFNTHLLGYSVTFPLFFFCARTVFIIEKTKVSLLVVSAFSSKTSLKAHANLCSVKELHWESQLWWKLVAEIDFHAIVMPFISIFVLSRWNLILYSTRHTSFPLNRVRPHQCSSYDLPHLHATLDLSGECSL